MCELVAPHSNVDCHFADIALAVLYFEAIGHEEEAAWKDLLDL